MGRVMLSKSLTQFSVDGWGCIPSLLFDLKQRYGKGMKAMATSFKRSHVHTVALSAPDPAAGRCQLTGLPETPGHSWASLGKSLVGSLLLFPGSWCAQGFICALQESASPVLCKFSNQIPLAFKVSTLAWRIPWMEELGSLQSVGLQIVGHD